jgi:hypothetical protein
LHGGKKEADERPDDRDHDEELDEREGPLWPAERGRDAGHKWAPEK